MANSTKDIILFSKYFLKISIKDTSVIAAIIEKP